MKKILQLISLALNIYGDQSIDLSIEEKKYGRIGPMKKAIVAKRNIQKGEKLTLNNIWFKRTQEESKIKQNQLFQLIGLVTIIDIKKDEIIDFSKVKKKG